MNCVQDPELVIGGLIGGFNQRDFPGDDPSA
jgi:hypothetical protein